MLRIRKRGRVYRGVGVKEGVRKKERVYRGVGVKDGGESESV